MIPAAPLQRCRLLVRPAGVRRGTEGPRLDSRDRLRSQKGRTRHAPGLQTAPCPPPRQPRRRRGGQGRRFLFVFGAGARGHGAPAPLRALELSHQHAPDWAGGASRQAAFVVQPECAAFLDHDRQEGPARGACTTVCTGARRSLCRLPSLTPAGVIARRDFPRQSLLASCAATPVHLKKPEAARLRLAGGEGAPRRSLFAGVTVVLGRRAAPRTGRAVSGA